MRPSVAVVISLALCLYCCSDLGSSNNPLNPEWLEVLIGSFLSTPFGTSPQSVWRYEYHGQIVYYIPAQCCDLPSALFDYSGKIICAPDGGFSGRGDGRCPDFFQERQNELLIWRDPRSR